MQKTNYPTNVTDNQWKATVHFLMKKENENTATEKYLTLLFIC